MTNCNYKINYLINHVKELGHVCRNKHVFKNFEFSRHK